MKDNGSALTFYGMRLQLVGLNPRYRYTRFTKQLRTADDRRLYQYLRRRGEFGAGLQKLFIAIRAAAKAQR